MRKIGLFDQFRPFLSPDKKLLLIDILQTRETLYNAAHALFEGFPSRIHILTLCLPDDD